MYLQHTRKLFILFGLLATSALLMSACSTPTDAPAPAVEDNAVEADAAADPNADTAPDDTADNPRQVMLDGAAAELGITAADLEFAIGNTRQIDFAAASELLGIPAEEIETAVQNNRPQGAGNGNGANGGFPPPFLAALEGAATDLGIAEDDLTAALGDGFPIDWEAAASTLGITADELQTAFQDNGFRGQGNGGQGNGGGQGNREEIFTAVAESLGVSVEDLNAAAGQGRPNIEAIADALGLPVEEVQAAFDNNRPQGGGNGRGQGNGNGNQGGDGG